ncbi:MAG: Yip1 protein, partial [Gemmatimonadetes bacterium]|nr:Yip1 protein [Gemmatimonadota bacterium]
AAKIRSDPSLTPERVEMAREMGQKFQKVGVFIILPVTMFVVGLMLWLCGKLVDARQTLGAALMVTCYAYVPKVLEAVLAGVQALVLDPSSLNGRFRLTFGIGRFLDPDATSPILLALVGRIDLFTIWVTVLLAIGLSVTGKVPRQRAALAAALVWALGAVPGVLQALSS